MADGNESSGLPYQLAINVWIIFILILKLMLKIDDKKGRV